MLCYRCGGHVKDGAGRCITCGQPFDPGLKAGPAAGFGAGVRRPRAVEGTPCQPGDRIAGRYEVREHIGSGPLGWMYRAFESTNAGEVAVKILSPRFLQTAEEKRVFGEELQKARRLSHPNISCVYEAGEDGGRPFVAGQFLEGLTLRRIIDLRRQKGQRFTLQEVEPIAAQIAAALEAANPAFAHGNLKPDNVIVLPDLLKLTDFGLAVSLPRAPFMAAQKAAGAHRYLAPEFLLGEALDARTDVFSLGMMLGEMLSGSLSDGLSPALPESVEALLQRAVSPRPNARFATASELAAELSEIASGMPRRAARVEDAGDVVIVEAQTDPRLRIARALGATPELLTAETAVRTRPRRGAGKRGRIRSRRPAPTEAAVAIGPTTPALEPIRPQTQVVTSFAASEEKRGSRAAVYAVVVIGIVLVGGGWAVLSARTVAPTTATSPSPSTVTSTTTSTPTPTTTTATTGTATASTVAVEPKHAMRDRVKEVRDRVEKALEERKRKKEEAQAKRQEESEKIEPDAFAGQVIRAPAPPLPPEEVMVTKERKVATADFSCPAGMQRVPAGIAQVGSDASDELRAIADKPLSRVELKGYCIDQYEFPNQPGKLPKVAATWSEADAQCRGAGKRLCSEEEWENACRGPQNLRFPYGKSYDPDACNTADAKENARQTTVAGAFTRCKSGYGVWDLSGNAAEWTASPFDASGPDRTVKGGHSARPGSDDRCASRRKLAPGQHSINVGFRCCADAR